MLSLPNLRALVLIRCCIWFLYPELSTTLPDLDVFESIASKPALHPNDLAFLRPIARTAHFYQTICPDPTVHGWFDVDQLPPATEPRLKRCSFTWLEASPAPSDSSPDPLVTLRSALETANNDVTCTFECVRSKATEEETIERILEDLVV